MTDLRKSKYNTGKIPLGLPAPINIFVLIPLTLVLRTLNSGRVFVWGRKGKTESFVMWCRGVVVITTAQLHSTKPELRFCAS